MGMGDKWDVLPAPLGHERGGPRKGTTTSAEEGRRRPRKEGQREVGGTPAVVEQVIDR